MSLSDTDSASLIASSSWERMSREAEEYKEQLISDHCRALEELFSAESEATFFPGAMSETRLVVAEVKLSRIEKRLGRQ